MTALNKACAVSHLAGRNKALASKCIKGKFLIPENRVIEGKLNNSPNNENFNEKLCLGFFCFGLFSEP
jgi:hypothetical protein